MIPMVCMRVTIKKNGSGRRGRGGVGYGGGGCVGRGGSSTTGEWGYKNGVTTTTINTTHT